MIADWQTRERLDRLQEVYKTFRVNQRETANEKTYRAACNDFESGYVEMLQELRARAQHDRMLLIETASRLITSEACRGAWTSDEEACTQAVRMAQLLIAAVDKPETP